MLLSGSAAIADGVSSPVDATSSGPVVLSGDEIMAGAAAGDQFGRSIAFAGDIDADGVNDVIVGAPFSDARFFNGGVVEVYSCLSGNRIFQKKPQRAGDRLGWSVTSVGDVNGDGFADFAAGAPYFANRRGRAYVYSGADGRTLYLFTGERANSDFGHAVSGGYDVDGDGTPDIVVGAPLDDSAAIDAGKVYAYSGATGALIGSFEGEKRGDRLGWSVAALGVSNNDRFRDIVVGAPLADDRAPNAGKIYVISGRTFQTLFTKLGYRNGDQFGYSVASIGRANAGAREDFVVGAPFYDPGGRLNAGRIDVFDGGTGQRLFAKTGQAADDRFGFAVGAAKEIDVDFRGDVIVGAPRNDTGGNNAGRAYVYSGASGAIVDTFEGLAPADQFGWSVDGLGSIGGPSKYVLVGAPFADTVASNAGRAYVPLIGGGVESAQAPDGFVRETAADRAEAMRRLLLAWGDPSGEFDEDGDGVVDQFDLLALLASW